MQKKNLYQKNGKLKKVLKLINLIEKKKKYFKLSTFYKSSRCNFRIKLQKLTAFGLGEIENEILKLSKLIIEFNKIINSQKSFV